MPSDEAALEAFEGDAKAADLGRAFECFWTAFAWGREGDCKCWLCCCGVWNLAALPPGCVRAPSEEFALEAL